MSQGRIFGRYEVDARKEARDNTPCMTHDFFERKEVVARIDERVDGVTVAGGPRGPVVYQRRHHSFAACRDEKLMNVSGVKVFDEERTWVNRVTCEIVFQPVSDTS